MKLENMDATSSSDSECITPDVNLMSDELNFSPISKEARESGDGDSGAESKENPDLANTEDTTKKLKDKRVSKIPVRRKSGGIELKIEDSETSWDLSDADGIPTREGFISQSCADLEVAPILEAPEEFRCEEAEPEEGHREPSSRDGDNACLAETGDTSCRAEVEGIRSEESPNQCCNNAVVGSAAPGDTPRVYASAEAMNEPPVEAAAEQSPTTGPSIAIGVAKCAQASGCSRVSTAKVCVAEPPNPIICASNTNDESETQQCKHLSWKFENGRLVFEENGPGESADSDNDEVTLLSSKDLNRRVDEGRSRLKYLEQKLKEAGITDGPLEQVVDKSPDYDANQNIVKCEFDVRQVGSFSPITHWEVYDELKEVTDDTMGIDGERAKHNPDRDNLKSLLKRPGKNKDKRSNRVVFNENKNEFFDADYIILIREECDYDEEDDDGVCTCNQHEMVRLTCCEPNCNCNVYDGYEQTPQSPKFAPPLEFVDAVTLSPPEGYKDMELEEQQLLALQQMARRGQRTAVCRECSGAHDDDEDGDGSQSDNEACGEANSDHEEQEEKEKTDQSQQTTPTTPPNDSDSPNSQRYILETITMTSVTEQRILREVEEERKTPPINNAVAGGSPINGILKGGKLWKQQSIEASVVKPPEPQQLIDSNVASDEEGGGRRSVRFIESEQNKRDSCDGAPDNSVEENIKTESSNNQTKQSSGENCSSSISPESTEMMLTFKLGNHVLISNNSLKPNSAVRQLFPCTKQLNGKAEDESIHQYLVTAESLRAFEEAKRSKLPQIIQSGETDESIKRAIERNTLRRSLIRYEPRSKKNVQKTDNSLVERIKQLTCDVDDINQTEEITLRASPPGEETKHSPEVNPPKNTDKSFSPSSSSTASSNSSSMSSTYKKITDLFGKRDKIPDSNPTNELKVTPSLPDLGNGSSHIHEIAEANHVVVSKVNSTNDSRKQFLSTLAPLTACVGGLGNGEEYYYQMNNHVGERASVASSVGTEYSLEDIDEGLKTTEEESKKIAPDVLAGTPSASESGDELAMFVQQDASRIERIKKKYQPEQSNKDDEDDEHDDYGFNRRPSVRGIKPRFGSTTEILQQIQNQLQPPAATARVAWPYYSESGLTVDNSKSRNMNQNMPNYQYPNVPEEVKTRNIPPQYRPTSLQDENIYQNCANQRCIREVYRANGNQTYSSFVKVGGCTEYYQSFPRTRNGRPQSPPPLELSKAYHQTMVYIPYNHIEGYHSPYYQSNDYARVSNQNQINKRYIEPIYQQRIHEEPHYNMLPMKPIIRPHLMPRSESPVPQFSTARSTQTPLATASYYGTRYRPMVGPWPTDCNYVKANRHSFPSAVPRYPPADSVSTDSDSQHSQINGLGYPQKDSLPNSPTKPRFHERGVPEGAAANVLSQDATSQSSSSTMTSPTSPQNPPPPSQKPMFYAMNV
ncbi:uncharacterized protein LOC123013053 [Tribolium madens]|uniref:uncharacterized protein LOC123013053 n=1 Tax=Tribolium madens TaxID=41895 RepID=UPI001CF72AE9|nr:uncharacterized protein LOC123013053 [Tribolium madens]XP_044267298.1 uncharacterized protein LOC123013053 [Tribolium madens]